MSLAMLAFTTILLVPLFQLLHARLTVSKSDIFVDACAKSLLASSSPPCDSFERRRVSVEQLASQ